MTGFECCMTIVTGLIVGTPLAVLYFNWRDELAKVFDLEI